MKNRINKENGSDAGLKYFTAVPMRLSTRRTTLTSEMEDPPLATIDPHIYAYLYRDILFL